MSAEPGAIAIWHDIAPEGRENFYAWHGSEHMPERVSIPGFLRGRRFVAIEAAREFFNLYETRSADIVAGPDYKARLDNPTPWTLRSVQSFARVARALCRVAASAGTAQGGLVATAAYDLAAADEAAHVAALARDIVPALAALPGVAAAQLLIADRAASGYVNAEQRARGTANAVPAATLIVEGWGDEASFMAAMYRELTLERLAPHGAEGPLEFGLYRHQATCWPPA